VAEGEREASRSTWRATRTGDFKGVPPTGAAVREGGMTFDRIAGDRIVGIRSS
jgi:predicted ester cyclase